jgi:hypothetical protein
MEERNAERPTDVELMEAVVRRDSDAMAAIYQRYESTRRRVSPRSCFPWNSRNEPTLTRSCGPLSNRWTAMESISCQSYGITR